MIVEAGDNKLENWLKKNKKKQKKKHGSHENVLFACKKSFTGLAQYFGSGPLPYCPSVQNQFLSHSFLRNFYFKLKFEAFPIELGRSKFLYTWGIHYCTFWYQ